MAFLGAHINGLGHRSTAAGAAVSYRGIVAIPDQSVLIALGARWIGGGISQRVGENIARNLRQLRIITGDILVLVQLHDLLGCSMRRSNGHDLAIVAAAAIRRIGVIDIYHHRDGIEHHGVGAHGSGIFNGLLQS